MLELRDALLPWDYKSFTLVSGTDWRQRTDLLSRVINKVEQEVRRYINKYGEGKLERIGIDFHELETVDWVDSFKACINEEFVKRLYHLTVTMRDLLISKAGVKGALWIPKLWIDISYAWTSVC